MNLLRAGCVMTLSLLAFALPLAIAFAIAVNVFHFLTSGVCSS